MSFVRAKEIPPRSGNWYDYEVMTTRVDGHVRQKVIQYLGKHGPDYSGRLIGDTGKPSISNRGQSRDGKVSVSKKASKANKYKVQTLTPEVPEVK